MATDLKRVAVIGATGPTGIYLVGEFKCPECEVLAVSRSAEKLERYFPVGDIECLSGDAFDAEAMRRAVAGCDLVVDCIGLPAERIQDHAVAARNIAAAARSERARCLQVSSFWSFLPVRDLPLNENSPREGGNRYARARREAEDIMLEAGAAVVHLPDFYGPYVHTSTLQMALQEAVRGKTMNWIGSTRMERDYAFVPDAMATVAELAEHPEAYGESWIIPGGGGLTAERVVEIVSAHLEQAVKARAAPGWLLKTMSVASPGLRSFRPILDDYLQPIRYDTGKIERLLGERPVTPYDEAIPKTLDWLLASL